MKACGKFPSCWPVCGSISSPYNSSGPANDNNLAHSLRALWYSPISHRADTSQNEQIVKLPSSPLKPSSVSSTL